MKIKPATVRLDASTVCQLKCPSCSTAKGYIAKTIGSKFLKFHDFKSFLDTNSWITHIELSNWGEIFLNRDLLNIIQYAFEKGVGLSAGNGVNLNNVNDDVIEGLVKYQFRMMTCSIDGASQETYKLYRQGGDFNRVISYIKRINAFKKQYQSDFPKLKWQFIAFGHNEHEIPAARQMAEDLHMDFYVKLAHGQFSPIQNKALIRAECGAADLKEYEQKFGHFYLMPVLCSQLWNQPQINADGRVMGCCVNFWGDYGNAFKDDLIAILNNERMNYARNMVLGKVPAREDVPCAKCHFYNEMKTQGQWMSLKDLNHSYFK